MPIFARKHKKPLGIYVHVPFCRSKCTYCDFYSVAPQKGVTDSYVAALCRKIDEENRTYDTVYFGGGTPTLLSPSQLERILGAIERNFGIENGAEITAETNPKTADKEKLGDMRSVGINRLSIGMQSVHDNELRALGRIHNFEDFKTELRENMRGGDGTVNRFVNYTKDIEFKNEVLNWLTNG